MNNFNLRSLKAAFVGTVLAGSLGLAASVEAQVPILDQIGPSSATLGTTSASSQFFEPALASDSIAAVDDFRAPVTLLDLTEVQAAVQLRGGSYSGVTGWSVEIYSSAAAAAGNLTGDVASINLTPAQVNVNTAFGPAADGGSLVTLPVNIVLPAAGTYFLSVIATNNFESNGQTFVTESAFGTTGTNAFLANPGKGLGGTQALNADLAYRIFASPVPEPSAYALMALGGIALLATIRLRRQAA